MPKLDIDYVRSQFPAFNDPLSAKWSFLKMLEEAMSHQMSLNV